MAHTENSFPKDFNLDTLVLTPLDGRDIDLRYIYSELNIFEDIYDNAVSGNLAITDANNQIKNLPIMGFEQITIKFNSPGKRSLSGKYVIYKISDRVPDADKSQKYILHFCSMEQIINDSANTGISYNGFLISDMVAKMQKDFLMSSFYDIEPTKFLHSFIIPNTFSPFQSINWLSTRANSAQFAGANYMYFQNQLGYNFTSLERLNSRNTVIEYVYGIANVRRTDQGNVRYNDRNLELEQRGITEYTISNHIDVLDNLISGMYANRVYTYDFLKKQFNFTDYNYSDSFNTLKHVESNTKFNPINNKSGPTKLAIKKLQNLVSPASTTRFYVANTSDPFPNRVENWLGLRISQLQEINNITLNITVPGDSERVIGETVSVLLPSAEPAQNKELQFDTYFQGRYLISSLKHTIQQDKYVTKMELVKDSVFSPITY
jgi:hypothetical protein